MYVQPETIFEWILPWYGINVIHHDSHRYVVYPNKIQVPFGILTNPIYIQTTFESFLFHTIFACTTNQYTYGYECTCGICAHYAYPFKNKKWIDRSIDVLRDHYKMRKAAYGLTEPFYVTASFD